MNCHVKSFTMSSHYVISAADIQPIYTVALQFVTVTYAVEINLVPSKVNLVHGVCKFPCFQS